MRERRARHRNRKRSASAVTPERSIEMLKQTLEQRRAESQMAVMVTLSLGRRTARWLLERWLSLRKQGRGDVPMRFQDSARQMNDPTSEGPLILPFSAIDAGKLALVGGKAANLGELTRGGFPVPEGFCVTTNAYALITDGIGLEPILDELAVTRSDDTTRLQDYAAVARASLLAATIPTILWKRSPGRTSYWGRGTKRVCRCSSTLFCYGRGFTFCQLRRTTGYLSQYRRYRALLSMQCGAAGPHSGPTVP